MMASHPAGFVEALGARVNAIVARLGFASRFFWVVLKTSGTSFRRIPLTVREIYFAGVLSLIIIVVSGLFVGMVLGLQGFETLQKYGAQESIGVLVALSLVVVFFVAREYVIPHGQHADEQAKVEQGSQPVPKRVSMAVSSFTRGRPMPKRCDRRKAK